MRFFKNTNEDYITCISTIIGEVEITEAEYNTILDIIRNKPTAPEGFAYHLKTDLTWELVELPPMPDPEDDELTAEEALDIITGGAE